MKRTLLKTLNKKGMVYLVGAGPGDPGLITVKGVECIRKADVVIYDYLVNRSLLNYTPPDAKKIYVGKRGAQHTLEQDEINLLLIKKAKQGKVVVRLKGGDPYLFGRGGEEAEAVAGEGIAFEVVPGVTAGIAAPAYAGIPVTHRDFTSTLALITGHEARGKKTDKIDWGKIASIGTLVFYMGIKNLASLIKNLLIHGRTEDTPVAIIRWGTTHKQETIAGTLGDIIKKVEEKRLLPPAIVIVGKVVDLRDKLNWFETKPLFGKRIIVTRAREQASKLSARLEEFGAKVIELPTIKIMPISDYNRLDSALRKIGEFDWLIFTSVNGVDGFFNRLFKLGMDTRVLKGAKICSVGPATTERLLSFGVKSDCQPSRFVAEAVLEELRKTGEIKGKKVLMPRSEIARELLCDELTKMGAKVADVAVYRTVADSSSKKELIRVLKEEKVDMVTFTSSSTVRNFIKLAGKRESHRIARDIKFASIGPITSKTIRDYGFKVSIEAKEYTIPGLVNAIVEEKSEGIKSQ
jgi:uroporphyrinogen III methyltransferase/synthase